MKGRMILGAFTVGLMLVLVSKVILAQTSTNSTFTYQGYLEQNLQPVNATCDFKFRLYSEENGGIQIGPEVVSSGVDVYRGIFSVKLDFGGEAFTGAPPWLEVEVYCPPGNGEPEMLSRIELTNAPRADRTYWEGLLNIPSDFADGIDDNTTYDAGSGLNISGSGSNYTLSARFAGNGTATTVARSDHTHLGQTWSGGCCDAFRLESSGHRGIVIVDPGDRGIQINDTGDIGVAIFNSGDRGIQVQDSTSHGIVVSGAGEIGLWVGNVIPGNLAADFDGPIETGGCNGCLLLTTAINIGDNDLMPGDIVSIQGVLEAENPGSIPLIMQVELAQSGQAVVGVVYSRIELSEREEASEVASEADTIDENANGQPVLTPTEKLSEDLPQQRLTFQEGSAKPGDFVSIVIYGPVQVKANIASGSIVTGTQLAVTDNSEARALQTVEVNGVRLAESAPTIGIALESLETDQPDDLIWVLVNPH